MKLFLFMMVASLWLGAEPLVQVWPADSAMCREQGTHAQCQAGSPIHFTDGGACACLKDGVLTHPRKCMIGPMHCDVKKNERYQWFYRFGTDVPAERIFTGCACVKE